MFTQKACIKSRPAVMITVTSLPGKKFYRTSGRMGHNPGQFNIIFIYHSE